MADGVMKVRLERLADERDRTYEKINDLLAIAEEEKRELGEFEQEQISKYRSSVMDMEEELVALAGDVERIHDGIDVSQVLRRDETVSERQALSGAVVHRTFAQFARDQLIVRRPDVARMASPTGDVEVTVAEAQERLSRTVQNVTSTTVAGLIVPTYVTQIMDIISRDRPVVQSGRQVPLDRGSLVYPKIGTRPSVELQSAEKTEAGTVAPTVTSATLTANTYLGSVDISWQAVNWSNPDVLALYFDLAAEAYARQTEGVACEAIESGAVAGGTVGTVGTSSGRLGTTGTESFAQWRSAVGAGLAAIYAATGGRHRTNTLYLSAGRFFQLATLGTDQVVQMSPIGGLDFGSMSGQFFGLNVVGSYGFDQDTAVVGDSQALLVGENPGNPVEMRVIEPNIGGYLVGLIGAFNAVVFDSNRFEHLGTHL